MPKNFSALRAAWCPCPSRPSQKKNVKNNFLRCAQHGAPTLPPPSQKKKGKKIFLRCAQHGAPTPPSPSQKKKVQQNFFCAARSMVPLPRQKDKSPKTFGQIGEQRQTSKSQTNGWTWRILDHGGTDGPGGL